MRNAKRRELVTLAAAIAFGANLDEPAERILAAAEPQVPTRVRDGDVTHLRSVTETLITWYNRAGGGAVHHHALAALRWATAMRQSSCTPAVRVELAVTTADLADIAAWFTFDAGQHEPARGLSLLSLQAARESGDLGMRANVASGLARQEIRKGNWAAGLDLTQPATTTPPLTCTIAYPLCSLRWHEAFAGVPSARPVRENRTGYQEVSDRVVDGVPGGLLIVGEGRGGVGFEAIPHAVRGAAQVDSGEWELRAEG